MNTDKLTASSPTVVESKQSSELSRKLKTMMKDPKSCLVYVILSYKKGLKYD